MFSSYVRPLAWRLRLAGHGAPDAAAQLATSEVVEAGASSSAGRVDLRQLALMYLWVGTVGFGGKPFVYLFDALLRRRWATPEDITEAQTIGRLLPGPSGQGIALFLGQTLCGPVAGGLCLIPYLIPGATIMFVLSAFLFGSVLPAWLNGVLHGLAISAVAVLLASVVRMLPVGLKARYGAGFVVLAFVANGLLELDLVLVLLSLSLLSFCCNLPRRTQHG